MDTQSILWNAPEEPVTSFGIDVPAWIEQDVTPYDVAAIVQGGCASGAYMPAVTYSTALATMAEHGDDVLDYIDGAHGLGEIQGPDMAQTSWAGLAVSFVSLAVELWASSVAEELAEVIEEGSHTT